MLAPRVTRELPLNDSEAALLGVAEAPDVLAAPPFEVEDLAEADDEDLAAPEVLEAPPVVDAAPPVEEAPVAPPAPAPVAEASPEDAASVEDAPSVEDASSEDEASVEEAAASEAVEEAPASVDEAPPAPEAPEAPPPPLQRVCWSERACWTSDAQFVVTQVVADERKAWLLQTQLASVLVLAEAHRMQWSGGLYAQGGATAGRSSLVEAVQQTFRDVGGILGLGESQNGNSSKDSPLHGDWRGSELGVGALGSEYRLSDWWGRYAFHQSLYMPATPGS